MEKTMTQTDTQVKEKNKIEAQTETKTESRADAQENEYVWKNGHPTEEEVLCQSSCMGFFRLFNNLRKQRGIKLEQLVNGIMNDETNAFNYNQRGRLFFQRKLGISYAPNGCID